MYYQTGLTDPFSAEKYARKALEYSQNPYREIFLYYQWGDALQIQNRGVTGAELADARRKVVLPYLYGIKAAIGHGVPDKKVPLPVWEEEPQPKTIKASEIEEIERKATEKRERFAVAKQKAVSTNHLVMNREGCAAQIIFLYSRSPFDTDELRQIALGILEDQEAVDKLAVKVDTAIRERLQKQLDPKIEEMVKALNQDVTIASTKKPVEQIISRKKPVEKPKPIEIVRKKTNYVLSIVLIILVISALTTVFIIYKRGRLKRS